MAAGSYLRFTNTGNVGIKAVQELIRNVPADQLDPVAPTQIWEHASGFRSSPYADVRPAGSDIARSMRSAAKMAP